MENLRTRCNESRWMDYVYVEHSTEFPSPRRSSTLEGKGVPLGTWEVACARGNLVLSGRIIFQGDRTKINCKERYDKMLKNESCRIKWAKCWERKVIMMHKDVNHIYAQEKFQPYLRLREEESTVFMTRVNKVNRICVSPYLCEEKSKQTCFNRICMPPYLCVRWET